MRNRKIQGIHLGNIAGRTFILSVGVAEYVVLTSVSMSRHQRLGNIGDIEDEWRLTSFTETALFKTCAQSPVEKWTWC